MQRYRTIARSRHLTRTALNVGDAMLANAYHDLGAHRDRPGGATSWPVIAERALSARRPALADVDDTCCRTGR
jgi:hypothetical protein